MCRQSERTKRWLSGRDRRCIKTRTGVDSLSQHLIVLSHAINFRTLFFRGRSVDRTICKPWKPCQRWKTAVIDLFELDRFSIGGWIV